MPTHTWNTAAYLTINSLHAEANPLSKNFASNLLLYNIHSLASEFVQKLLIELQLQPLAMTSARLEVTFAIGDLDGTITKWVHTSS